jgi:hypothetical protein
LSLWYAVNWCRELLNCFSVDVNLRAKVMARLEYLVLFQKLLDAALTNISWTPPGFESAAMENVQNDKMRSTSSKSKKSKSSILGNPTIQRLKLVHTSLAALHPCVMSILPDHQDDQGCIDSASLLFLISHFYVFLGKAMSKVYSKPPYWTTKPISQRTKPHLQHSPFDESNGFDMFEKYLSPKLVAVGNNARWALQSLLSDVNNQDNLRAILLKYFQCITVLAISDVFSQQHIPLVQVQALQDLVVPTQYHTALSSTDIQTLAVFDFKRKIYNALRRSSIAYQMVYLKCIVVLQIWRKLKLRCNSSKRHQLLNN